MSLSNGSKKSFCHSDYVALWVEWPCIQTGCALVLLLLSQRAMASLISQSYSQEVFPGPWWKNKISSSIVWTPFCLFICSKIIIETLDVVQTSRASKFPFVSCDSLVMFRLFRTWQAIYRIHSYIIIGVNCYPVSPLLFLFYRLPYFFLSRN